MIDKAKIQQIPLSSSLYPTCWKKQKDAPPCIYGIGNIQLLQDKHFTIVGSRRTPVNALKLGKQIAEELTSHFTLVTGTAEGGDTSALEGGLKSGKVIGVLAGGFSAIPQSNYPLLEEVAKKGLLLCLHPFDTPVREFSYGYRNKFIALLGEGTLVLGASQKSGALITANYAKKENKKIFAFPYPPNNSAGEGCNALIKQGGYLTETTADILNEYHLTYEKKAQPCLTEPQAKVMALLKEKGEEHLAVLAQVLQIPVFQLRAVLSALEMKGLIVSVGGNRFAVI